MSIKEKIDKYLKNNLAEIQAKRSSPGFSWTDIAADIKVDKSYSEYIRGRHRYLLKTVNVSIPVDTTIPECKFNYQSGKEDKSIGTKEFTFTADNIPSDEEIIEHFKIDTVKYRINQIYHKTSFGGKYAITVSLLANKPEHAVDYKKQFEEFLNNLNKSVLNRPSAKIPKENTKEKNNCLYLPIFDAHIGKLAHKSTSGDDYDLKIAIERYTEAIQNLVYSAYSSYNFEEICLVTGSDLLHVDSKKNETTSGTPQDADSRFEKVYEKTLSLLVDTIDFLKSFAPVKVIMVRGNHAEHLEYTLGVSLKWIYKSDRQVSVDAEAFLRKYYKYGNTGILISHGDKEKHDNLPLIFATENKELWASTEYHQIHLGHLHTDRKKVFLTSNEYSGCQVSIFPSLSGDDYWHSGKGYNLNQKRAVAIIYNRELGEIAKLNYVI